MGHARVTYPQLNAHTDARARFVGSAWAECSFSTPPPAGSSPSFKIRAPSAMYRNAGPARHVLQHIWQPFFLDVTAARLS